MGAIACFVDGIHCNVGLICLDWRQVCDGIMQCEDTSAVTCLIPTENLLDFSSEF